MSSYGLPVAEQIAHINEHKEQFDSSHGAGRTVEEYFEEYLPDHPDLYYNLCCDLDLEPRGNWDFLFDYLEEM